MKITVIGAGAMGAALVRQLAGAGHEIRVTARNLRKAQQLAQTCSRVSAHPAETALGGSNVVIVATAYADAVPALRALGDLTGKIVVDITNPLTPDGKALKIGHTTSAAEEIARALPGVEVVKAFNTVFAQVLAGGPQLDGHQVAVFFAGDSERARQTVRVLIESMGLRAVDTGNLINARYLEPMGALNIYFGYGTEMGTSIAPIWLMPEFGSMAMNNQISNDNDNGSDSDSGEQTAAGMAAGAKNASSPAAAPMPKPLPTLFISHGSPMLALEDSPASRFLQGLGRSLPRPKAIVVFSAHWESMGGPAVSFAPQPETIHDFGGFPEALFAIQYPAAGTPDTATQASDLLELAGFAVKRSATRGLDHGAWVPLRLMYPEADIPVLQVSILRGASPAQHAALGHAIAALREQGVLIIGSGSLTHNLYEFRGQGIDAEAPAWVTELDDWIKQALQDNNREALFNYRTLAPSAVRNHPTEEHLLPLFVAMGAAGDHPNPRRLHASYEYGVLAMDAYAF